jgi:hypothetical protein
MRNSLYLARVSSLSRFHDHIQTLHTRYDSSGRVISPTQRPPPDKTQQLQQTNIHAPDGIRNRKPSKRAAADCEAADNLNLYPSEIARL